MSLVCTWMSGAYHMLPVRRVYIEDTINFLSSLCSLPYFFKTALCDVLFPATYAVNIKACPCWLVRPEDYLFTC